MFRILVAEDDDSARFLMCEVLRRAGYDPCPARDGLEALEVMEQDVYKRQLRTLGRV